MTFLAQAELVELVQVAFGDYYASLVVEMSLLDHDALPLVEEAAALRADAERRILDVFERVRMRRLEILRKRPDYILRGVLQDTPSSR